jgi:predicted TIM-barrel fold metal-dependent hydrolase
MNIEISMGEAVDRHTILQIKAEFIKDEEKLKNVREELEYLNKLIINDIYFSLISIDDLELMHDINLKLWNVEDKLRELEREKRFDQEFIELAREVYFTNDKRAEVKKRINLACGSRFIEEKSYAKY